MNTVTAGITAYEKGYESTINTPNPFGVPSVWHGDWNLGFMDKRAGRLPRLDPKLRLLKDHEVKPRAQSDTVN